jgi:hypothetical protein
MSPKKSQQPFSPRKTNQNDSDSRITNLCIRAMLKVKREEREGKKGFENCSHTHES